MRIFLLFLFGLFFISEIYAQDIIQFKNQETVEAKVLEIGLKNILFKLKEDTTKIYSVGKEEVYLIRYINGFIDTIKYTAPKIVSEYVTKPTPYQKDILSVYNKKNIEHNGRGISDDELYRRLNNYHNFETRKELLQEFSLRKKHKRNQHLARILWPVLGFGIPGATIVIPNVISLFGTTTNLTGNQYDNMVKIAHVIGFSIRIGGNVFASISSNKCAHSTENIVDLYNNSNH